MYKIDKNDDFLLIRLEEDFDYNVMKSLIHHVTSIKEYPYTNDIWIIGARCADIRLGELEFMVSDFQCHCPRDAARTKTAIVVDPGLTESIIELWVSAVSKRVSFEMRMFHSLADARLWLEMEEPQMA